MWKEEASILNIHEYKLISFSRFVFLYCLPMTSFVVSNCEISDTYIAFIMIRQVRQYS